MNPIAIVVHGGAGADSAFIRENLQGIENGLRYAIDEAFRVLQDGGSAVDAVEKAVTILEDDPLFNAGRGSALNNKGEVEMDASIMDGETHKAGAVSAVRNVKNPVSLARFIMNHTDLVFMSGHEALGLARDAGIGVESDTYFVTDHQYTLFQEQANKEDIEDLIKKRMHGTVGAVALDQNGNLAAATSSGGTENQLPGRIGDSCVIGAGCYASNHTCAVSATGDGEFILTGVIAHSVAAMIELSNSSIQQACDHVIHIKNKNTEGDIGIIALDAKGNPAFSFNSERMPRAWKTAGSDIEVKIYGS